MLWLKDIITWILVRELKPLIHRTNIKSLTIACRLLEIWLAPLNYWTMCGSPKDKMFSETSCPYWFEPGEFELVHPSEIPVISTGWYTL